MLAPVWPCRFGGAARRAGVAHRSRRSLCLPPLPSHSPLTYCLPLVFAPVAPCRFGGAAWRDWLVRLRSRRSLWLTRPRATLAPFASPLGAWGLLMGIGLGCGFQSFSPLAPSPHSPRPGRRGSGLAVVFDHLCPSAPSPLAFGLSGLQPFAPRPFGLCSCGVLAVGSGRVGLSSLLLVRSAFACRPCPPFAAVSARGHSLVLFVSLVRQCLCRKVALARSGRVGLCPPPRRSLAPPPRPLLLLPDRLLVPLRQFSRSRSVAACRMASYFRRSGKRAGLRPAKPRKNGQKKAAMPHGTTAKLPKEYVKPRIQSVDRSCQLIERLANPMEQIKRYCRRETNAR